jgi:tripartite-type tricarboxylate transporter receptor subunit TctC
MHASLHDRQCRALFARADQAMIRRLVVKIPRRRFLNLAAGVAGLPVLSRLARADAYPSRPIRILVGFPAGGAMDILSRITGQWLHDRLGQPVIVENRLGATGNIATLAVVRAPADGYTLLAVGSPNAINASLYANPGFDFIRDIAPLASTVRLPSVMVVNPAFPAKTVPEFIAYAKANPGKVAMASAGNGTSGHVAGELFKTMAGVDLLHIPYRGGPPAVADLLGGRVQVLFDIVTNSIEQIRAGTLRALAITTEARCAALPDVPTVADFVPGYESSYWTGFGAPGGTSAEIVDRLNSEINAAFADPAIKARVADLGGTVFSGSAADFARLIAVETGKYARIVKSAGIKLE